MEIEKVIEIFEKCIPHYQKAFNKKWWYIELRENNLNHGICNFIYETFNIYVCMVFENHYKNYLHGDYLFKTPYIFWLNRDNKILEKSILPRLNFLKTEVKRLKKLQKLGYTHI